MRPVLVMVATATIGGVTWLVRNRRQYVRAVYLLNSWGESTNPVNVAEVWSMVADNATDDMAFLGPFGTLRFEP